MNTVVWLMLTILTPVGPIISVVPFASMTECDMAGKKSTMVLPNQLRAQSKCVPNSFKEDVMKRFENPGKPV